MSFSTPAAFPIYEGGGTSTLVPDLFDVALNGRPYMIDWKYQAEFYDESIRLLKPQQDSSGRVSEASLNPEDFARQGIESWHKGAGQTHLDREGSDPDRFRSSKGWNPWERWELSLLPDTEQVASSANTNLQLAVAGSRLAWLDGNAIKYVDDLDDAASTFTGGSGTWASLTSDGFYFYATNGSDVYQWDRTATAVGSAWNTLDCDLLAYVKGRLMAAHEDDIYNITSSSAPSAITVATGTVTTDFRWVGFAAGQSCIYAAGFQGDKSLIFRIGIKDDATGLDVAVQAGELPDGEIVRSIYTYLGFVCIGTDNGVRFAVPEASGDLTIGALIETDSAVRCFEGQGQFVWFGWTNYDSVSTGLGRLDLTVLNGSAPAYASDLMVTGQGNVLSVVTFAGKRVLAVSGVGVYAEADEKVASATIESGLITFGLPDQKVGMYVDLRHEPLAGSVAMAISNDGDPYVALTTSDETESVAKTTTAGQVAANTFELRLTGARDAVSTTGPRVTRLTLEANPAPGRGEFFLVPLLLHESVEMANGAPYDMNPTVEKDALVAMEVSGLPITYQDGSGSETVLLDDHRFAKEKYTKNRDGFNGTFLARLRRPRQRS